MKEHHVFKTAYGIKKKKTFKGNRFKAFSNFTLTSVMKHKQILNID